MDSQPSSETRQRIAALLSDAPTSFRRVQGGYTPADRWLTSSRAGHGAFAKVGTTTQTAEALRAEARVYSSLGGRFMPALVGFEDHPDSPILVIEDLHEARWPPPWDRALVDRVLGSLDALHSARAELAEFGTGPRQEPNGWKVVRTNPEPFLGLGWASSTWLQDALPTLIDAADEFDTAGSAVIHFDVRSDNLCLAERGVVLVDWNHACLGNPTLDLGFWLPSLEAEGGPSPEDLLPHAPEVAAYVSGFFAARAGLPGISDAPRVRGVQQQQLRTALPWAVRALGLAPLDPPSAGSTRRAR